jgi:ABC-type multidrug transport system fused ATPase/permease subunit
MLRNFGDECNLVYLVIGTYFLNTKVHPKKDMFVLQPAIAINHMSNQLYLSRSQVFQQLANQLNKTANRWSLLRSFFFLLAIFSVVYFSQIHWAAAVTGGILFLVCFFWTVKRHQKIQSAAQLNQRLALVNEQENAALEHNFSAFDPGTRYQDPLHPYTSDLDFFGKNSVYQFFNRTVTSGGSNRLAAFFSAPASIQDIIDRQVAIAELSTQLEWRQGFRARGMENPDEAGLQEKLAVWLSQTPVIYGNGLLSRVLVFLPIWNIAAVAYAAPKYPWYVSVLCLLPAFYLLRRFFDAVNQVLAHTSKAQSWLDAYTALIKEVETAAWSSPLLTQLQQEFVAKETETASKALGQLSYYLNQLNVRNNPFAIVLNVFGLWDLQWLYRLEGWKATWKEHLPTWINHLGELDALSSLANVHYNYPDWVFPKVMATDLNSSTVLSAVNLAHPLITAVRRIGNDLNMVTAEQVKLLTGSNMAGKSTFLRTLGVNLVLAQTGAPVCAQRLEMPALQVFTGMRTHDDLSENASSFYAELKRLRALLDAVEIAQHKGPQVFFLLDEILKGTNSRDRHSGSRGLILQLLRSRGVGFIATHDLELAVMESEYPDKIENCCMEVEIHDGQLFFDYKLKKGVSQSFNATVLMRQLGIGID